MKYLFTILAIIFWAGSFGQNAVEYLNSGIDKHNQNDLKGAIADYGKAIKADKTMAVAYLNRGMCELALKDYAPALKDFSKTIELQPNMADAYYSRATVLVSQQKYEEALPDLDKTIELKATTPNALTLRGQIRAQTGDKKGACEDFNQAKIIGDAQADNYLAQFCGNPQQDGESFSLYWPENENWKIGSNQENEQMTMLELIPSSETFENWTEIGTMVAIKGMRNVPMDLAMEMTFEEAKKNAPKSKLTFIEKNENVEYPWIIFTIESPSFKNDKNPESQLWYVIQGKTSLYTNFRAIKKATIPKALKEKWIQFFKTGEIVYQ